MIHCVHAEMQAFDPLTVAEKLVEISKQSLLYILRALIEKYMINLHIYKT
jgi:hypothetical protein